MTDSSKKDDMCVSHPKGKRVKRGDPLGAPWGKEDSMEKLKAKKGRPRVFVCEKIGDFPTLRLSYLILILRWPWPYSY